MRWQPIETAPKDGTEFKARGHNWGDSTRGYHRHNVIWFDGFEGPGWYNANDEDERLTYLTHWRPISEPQK